MFEVGDRVEVDLENDVWTGTVQTVQTSGDILWVASDISDLVTWFPAKIVRKIEA